MRATLSHFLSKMGLKRPGGPSSQVTPFPPSSDSSLPESLRVLTLIDLQLLDKPELSGITTKSSFVAQRVWTSCALCGFSAPAAPAQTPLFTAREPLWHAKTQLFTAREPLWRSKWPLGPARVLLERSEGLFQTCFGATSALEMATLACPGAASALKKPAQACFDAASALKMAILACSGATSALKKPARAR